ncbi:MAG: hypothetical protein HWE16_13785 [Gammaproteobacteria bacterium]|nr:hypothetical protein [Gammaproteobacteria bacterium]
MTRRRQFLKAATKGIAVTSLIAVSGISIWQLSLQDTQALVEADDYDYQYLNQDDRLLLFAIIPAVLGKALGELHDESFVLKIMQQLDQAIDFISESSYQELRQLFDLLSYQLGRAYLAGVWQSWNAADGQALIAFLEDWKSSYLALLRSGYLGMHQLIMGTFYAQTESWQSIGYDGPVRLNLTDEFYQQFEL